MLRKGLFCFALHQNIHIFPFSDSFSQKIGAKRGIQRVGCGKPSALSGFSTENEVFWLLRRWKTKKFPTVKKFSTEASVENGILVENG